MARNDEKEIIMKVTKDMVIGEILAIDRNGIAPILIRAGFHCIGCPASQGETLEEAGDVHGQEIDNLVAEINEYLEGK